MPSPQSIAVVVLNWNGRALLEEFAPHWLVHTPEYAELVIVDNGSTDDSVAYLRAHYPQVRLITFDTNYGFAEGYNRAIAMLDHPIVVLLNSDAAPTAGWLEEPLALLELHPEVAAVQPKIRSYREPHLFEYAGAAGGYVDALGYPYCRGRILDTIEVDRGQYDSSVDVMWATGACLIIRRAVYLEAGGLDARFFAHQEEIDLCWRVRELGWRIITASTAVVYHLGGGSLDALNPRKTYLNFRNNLLMLYKHLPRTRLIWTLALRLGLDLLAALSFVAQGRWAAARAVVRAWYDAGAMRHSFAPDRRHNLASTHTPVVHILSARSILLDYMLRGRRTFDRLS